MCKHRGEKNANRILVGNPERKKHYEDLAVDGRTVLKLILDRIRLYELDLSGLR
jgi:hypothetical protein